MSDRLLLALAQGFGVGRIRYAPGTFGSALGLLWFASLLQTHHLGIFLSGMAVSFFVSVWVCGRAEKILGQTDPGSVVLDEIIAIPMCFLGPVISLSIQANSFPTLDLFFEGRNWWRVGLGFALFRFFDVVKPPPVRQLQRLPGGWGVTVDDVAAALYVNLVQLPFLL